MDFPHEPLVPVLGNSDDTKCTFPLESLRRQALYACKTCAESSGVTKAGICLACSLKCHEDHELYELYTKRDFRCDCGDATRFPGRECLLEPGLDRKNPNNSYNQNFEGKYCTCSRPYPDPEDTTEDSMIQCVVCEDWFHGRHLVGRIPADEDYSEMICQLCMSERPFLWSYYEQHVSKKMRTEENGTPSDQKEESTEGADCELKRRRGTSSGTGATFWPQGWRTGLCRCESCISLYAEKKCSFLVDEEDTVHFYEEEGRKRTRCASSCSTSSMERGMEVFGQMPHVQQVEMIHGYNDLKSALTEYLQSFAEKNEVVTKEHIAQFFQKFRDGKTTGPKPAVPSLNCR